MNILMLSDLETRGGAATAASRLANSLVHERHKVIRLLAKADQKKYLWHTIESIPSVFGLAAKYIFPKTFLEKYMIWERKKALRTLLVQIQPDVINVHNLHGARLTGWSYQLVQICTKFAPTIWTLHDMWSFTGRCAYSYDCLKFQIGCDAACPTPQEYPDLEPTRIAAAWQGRQKLFQKSDRLAAVTPSRWLANQAKSGFWAEHRIETIPYGLPTDVYKPVDRQLAQRALGIETDDPCILIVADSLADRRKGGRILMDALHFLSSQALTVITLGSDPFVIDINGVNTHNLGYVDHERTKVLAYSAADIYVHPAIADNLPNTVLESIACGTPVLGFPVGGVPEMVQPGKSGWLADHVSASALADTLRFAIDSIDENDLRSSCRELAETEYNSQLQAQRYTSLFKALL